MTPHSNSMLFTVLGVIGAMMAAVLAVVSGPLWLIAALTFAIVNIVRNIGRFRDGLLFGPATIIALNVAIIAWAIVFMASPTFPS